MKTLRYLWWEWIAPVGLGMCIGFSFMLAIVK